MRDNEASSPAPTGDATETGSDGLTAGQAAAQLFASSERAAKAVTQEPPEPAAEQTTPEQSETTTTPAAEAEAASADTSTEVDDTAEETPAEATTEDEGESVLSPSPTLSPAQQEILNKRIGKEVRKTEAIKAQFEARIAELEAKLKQAPAATTTAEQPQTAAPPPPPVGNQPLAEISDPNALFQLKQQAKEAVRFAEDTLDNPRAWKNRIETDPDTQEQVTTKVTRIGDKEYTESDIKAIMRRARITLEDHIPQREQFLGMRQRAVQAARQEFPFLTDKTSPDYQKAQTMLRDPWIQMRPDAEWIVATQIEGLKAIEARKAASKTKAEAPAKPKVPAVKPSSDQTAVSTTGAATRVAPDVAKRMHMKAESEKLMAKGGVTAAEAAAFLQRNDRPRNSR
jgi:hypothetical protein